MLGRTFCRWRCLSVLASLLAGCSGGAERLPPIRVPAPPLASAGSEPELPNAPRSTLGLTIELELKALAAQVDAALPRTQNQDWTEVTRPGASPRIELRYFVERDAPQLSWSGGALRTEIPLRYWADVRGAVKSPLPWQKNSWFELARDQNWGTRAAPQRTRLAVITRVQFGERGELVFASALEPLDPGPAPAGSFCVDAGIKLCTSKQAFAGEVRDAFKRRIEPALQKALAELDARLTRDADLRPRLEAAFAQLQCPFALHRAELACRPAADEQGLWLRFAPAELWADAPAADGDRLLLRVAVEGKLRLTRGAPPPDPALPLPALSARALDGHSVLRAPVALPYALLSPQLAHALPSPAFALSAGPARIVQARIAGASPDQAGSLVLEVKLAGAVDALVYAYAKLNPSRRAVTVARFEYTEASKRLLGAALSKADRATLRTAIERSVQIDLVGLAKSFEQLANAALSRSADPRLRPSVRITRVGLSKLRPGAESAAALLRIEADFRLRVDP